MSQSHTRGATGNRTPISAMRTHVLLLNYRPSESLPSDSAVVTFMVSVPLGRPRRNRTLSPSFGGSAGHHDSATHGIAVRDERLVRELNPSHSIDSGAATPVASRGICFENDEIRRGVSGVPGRSRTCVDRFRRPVPFHSATRTRFESASSAGVEPASTGLGNRRLSARPRGLSRVGVPCRTRTCIVPAWETEAFPFGHEDARSTFSFSCCFLSG